MKQTGSTYPYGTISLPRKIGSDLSVLLSRICLVLFPVTIPRAKSVSFARVVYSEVKNLFNMFASTFDDVAAMI